MQFYYRISSVGSLIYTYQTINSSEIKLQQGQKIQTDDSNNGEDGFL